MTALPAKVIALKKTGDHCQVTVEIGPKYRGSFNTLAFGDIKPYSGLLRNGRLDLIYYQDPGLTVGDQFQLWTLNRHHWLQGKGRTLRPGDKRPQSLRARD